MVLADAERAELERRALADWSPAAEACVTTVLSAGGRAVVGLALTGGYAYSVYFQRGDDGSWEDAGSASGPADEADLHW